MSVHCSFQLAIDFQVALHPERLHGVIYGVVTRVNQHSLHPLDRVRVTTPKLATTAFRFEVQT